MRKIMGFIFGPNGSGKGTLAEGLAKEFDYLHLDSGRNLREWAEKKKREDVLNLIDNGEFVDDETLELSLKDTFEEISHHKKIILDGMPRKVSQVYLVREICEKFDFEPLWIIVLHAPVQELVKRLKDRVVAPDGRNYHMILNPPPKSFKLSELKPRPDDRPEIIEKRYEYYITNTLECISDEFFINSKVLTIDATQSVEEVYLEGKTFIESVEAV